jgi:lipopolysaccharide transport system ATP-binding protein
MSSDAAVAIRAQGVGKRYLLGGESGDLLSERLNQLRGRGRTVREEFWALRGVDLAVAPGEVVGLVGRNGAGKSTLLKILSRITPPTEGSVEMRGRVGTLLEVGTGFHPELSGRENIYLSGTILGMRRHEVTARFDEIVDFSGVEQFLETPVKRYSSGMYVRLAFAVAAHLEPEILVVDEVLAVGDAEFQKRSLGKMHDVSRAGRTVLFVSHNMSAVQSLCRRAVWLEHGRVAQIGDAAPVVSQYLAHAVNSRDESAAVTPVTATLDITRFAVSPNPVDSAAPLTFSISFGARVATRVHELTVLFYSALDLRVAIVDVRELLPVTVVPGEETTIDGRISSVPFVEGEYYVGLGIGTNDFHGNKPGLVRLTVTARPQRSHVVPHRAEYRGIVELETRLSIKGHPAGAETGEH